MDPVDVHLVFDEDDAAESAAFASEHLAGGALRSSGSPDAQLALVLVGERTHVSPRVDAEVRAVLDKGRPLVIVCLDPNAQCSRLSPLLRANVESGHARFYRRPITSDELVAWATAARRRMAEADHPPAQDVIGWFGGQPRMADWMPATTWRH